jgi:hypothetical protein
MAKFHAPILLLAAALGCGPQVPPALPGRVANDRAFSEAAAAERRGTVELRFTFHYSASGEYVGNVPYSVRDPDKIARFLTAMKASSRTASAWEPGEEETQLDTVTYIDRSGREHGYERLTMVNCETFWGDDVCRQMREFRSTATKGR